MADEIVLVHYAESGPEALVIISLLQGEGIEYIMRNSMPAKMDFGGIAFDGGPIEFYVHSDDLERAKDCIKTLSEIEKDSW
ncbi:MAG: DUF2007 domain-containing protein [Actinobacteria bacterium]|nr:DUF2007 domain-containing protein [Actinomycetota bacterium]